MFISQSTENLLEVLVNSTSQNLSTPVHLETEISAQSSPQEEGSLCAVLSGKSWVMLLPRQCTAPRDLSEKLLMGWKGNGDE